MDVIQKAARFGEEDNTRKGAYILAILRALGWTSPSDTAVKKPNIVLAKKYIRKQHKSLVKLFGEEFNELNRKDTMIIIDTINPHLIHFWHVQIIGNVEEAKLELLVQVK